MPVNADPSARGPRTRSAGSTESAFVRPKTAQQAVADEIRREITTGVLAPGSPIIQEALAEQFSMSRIPVREALKTLEAEEYVTYAAHSGYRVAKLGLDELIEVFQLRALLEEALLRDAMAAITDQSAVDMRAQMAEIERAEEAGDVIAAGMANRQFHQLTFEPSRMARTKRIVNQLWNTADAYRPLYADLMDVQRVNCEHVLMVEAVERRDTEALVELNHRHREQAIGHLTAILGAAEASRP